MEHSVTRGKQSLFISSWSLCDWYIKLKLFKSRLTSSQEISFCDTSHELDRYNHGYTWNVSDNGTFHSQRFLWGLFGRSAQFLLICATKSGIFYYRFLSCIVKQIMFYAWAEILNKNLIECANIFTSTFITLGIRSGVPSKTFNLSRFCCLPFIDESMIAKSFHIAARIESQWYLASWINFDLGRRQLYNLQLRLLYKGPIHERKINL